MPPVLSVEDVDKRVLDRALLRGVSLHVEEGERVALVGDNGTGKSTLLRILAGVEPPDAGRRTTRRDLRVGFLPQQPDVDPARSVREEVRSGLARWQQATAALHDVHAALAEPHDDVALQRLLRRQAELDAEVERLGGHDREHEVEAMIAALGLPDPDALCGPLSGGEKRRTALARLLLDAPDVLLLDEPTNHLDAFASEWLEDRLLQSRSTLVLVTHDRYFLDRVVTRMVELDRGVLHAYDGAYADFLVQRAERLAHEERAERVRVNLLRRETEWMRRGPPARTTKAKARIAIYDKLVASEREAPDAGIEFAIPCTQRLGDRVLRLAGVSKRYGERPLLSSLDLEVGPGERLGIIGPNGAGKTTFLRIATGQLAPDTGEVAIGPTVRFAQIDQGRTQLDEDKTVLQEVGQGFDHVAVDGRLLRIETFLEQFGFVGDRKHTRVGSLSGGERHRVLLAKLLSQAGNVLVLDEPTNDLDLTTLRLLEEALLAFAGTALVVSHDRYFLDRVATRILAFDGQGRAQVHEGDLSSFLARGHAFAGARSDGKTRAAEGKSKPPARATDSAAPTPPTRKRLSTYERRELDALTGEIGALEAAVAALDARLADPALYTTVGADPQQIVRERTAKAADLEAKLARWVELEERA
ncbi:MAG: ABC-F family ATP-binding cassette domain-containing protein [Planctomycetota bacterium]